MSREALITEIVRENGCTKKEAEDVIKKFTSAVTSILSEGGEVSLVGFGKFEVKERPERQGRNPSTGEVMTIAAKKTPNFKAGAKLKEAVNS